MTAISPFVVINSQCVLGEGPCYLPEHDVLHWVDIKGQALHQYHLSSQQHRCIIMPDMLCWVLPCENGELLAGMHQQLVTLCAPDYTPKPLLTLSSEPHHNRLNDAKTDRRGNVIFGTMDNLEALPTGVLYRLRAGLPKPLDSGYVVSNGPAFSLNGEVIYAASSSKRLIKRFTLDTDGNPVSIENWITFDDDMGYPDGMTVDSEDHLWVAAWAGGAVYRFNPKGELVFTLPVPALQVTSVAFVGHDYKTLAVTSARIGLDDKTLKQYPHSGATFLFDVGVSGVAEAPVRHSVLTDALRV